MRKLMLIVILLAGCENRAGTSPNVPESGSVIVPTYSPETFRRDVSDLISSKRYSNAVAFLRTVDPKRQAFHDETGYYAVGEDLIVLPGVDPTVVYDRNRDWQFPGTSDAVEDLAWQRAATDFAVRYNQNRVSK